jgi:hypothetical protein
MAAKLLEAVGSGGGCAWLWGRSDRRRGRAAGGGWDLAVWVGRRTKTKRMQGEMRFLRSRVGHVELWGTHDATHRTTIDQEAASDGSPGGIGSFSFCDSERLRHMNQTKMAIKKINMDGVR